MRGGVGEVLALESPHPRGGHRRAEEGVLAGALHHPAPAGVASDIDHRREGPVDAVGRGFDGADPRGRFDGRRVEARRFGQGDREDGAPAVDHVIAEEQRDVQPRLFHGDPLHPAGGRGAPEVEERSDAPVAHQAVASTRRPGTGLVPLGRRHDQLADLLLQRHEREERVGDARTARRSGGGLRLGGRGTAAGRDGRERQEKDRCLESQLVTLNEVKGHYLAVSPSLCSG